MIIQIGWQTKKLAELVTVANHCAGLKERACRIETDVTKIAGHVENRRGSPTKERTKMGGNKRTVSWELGEAMDWHGSDPRSRKVICCLCY